MAFRELHHGPPILVLPNAWDAVSARLFEVAGFPAIGTTSAGVANVLGYADGQKAPREEVLFMVRRIAQTVQIPVTADIEAGYGTNSVEEVLKTVQGVLEAGAIGINLEDAADQENSLVDVGLQREKIQAIRALGDRAGVPLVINARTDAFHLLRLSEDEQFQLAVERANSYHEAGADSLFVPFITDPAIVARLAKAIAGPLNILAIHRATLGHVRSIAQELRTAGTYAGFMKQTIPYAEVNSLLTS
jgi:2-methylisocitrate lyase-like PEP mutase family enzyme